MKSKNFLIVFFLTGIFSLGFMSCQQTPKAEDAENVKHYRHIRFSETPYDDIMGSHSLSAEEALAVNNYQFTYDDQNRLISVEFKRGDELLDYSNLGAAKIVIEYAENKETLHFFNKDNEPQELAGVFTEVYELDENGNRTGLRFYDKEGNPVENRNKIAWYTWSTLDDGKIKENRFNLKGEEVVLNEFCPFYELRFSYGENGLVTRMENYQADTLYNCTAENCGDIGVSYFTFDYNEAGDLNKFTVCNTTGQLSNLYWGWAKFVHVFDEHGNVIERAYFDQDDEYLGGKRNPVSQYAYNEHGALVEVRMMDKDRNIINHPDHGAAIIKYEYNDKGHPVDTLRYDKDMVAL